MSTESEWKTRKTRIDAQLKALNPAWEVIPYKEDLDISSLTHHAVEEFSTENGPADYALFVNGKLLGIIEAKKVSVNPQNVLEQAKRYSRGCKNTIGEWNSFKVPFLYASNGRQIWFADVREDKYYSRELLNFHTPDALEEMFNRNIQKAKQWFVNNPIDFERLRPYQKEAISAVEKALIDNKRKMLLAMATGTGKTFTTVCMIYRLIKSGYAKRILFLVDRRALAAQAAQAFSAFITPSGNKFNQEYEVFSQRFKKEDFEEGEKFDIGVMPNEYLTAPNAGHTFVYVSTIQRMAINLLGREGSFEQSESDPDIDDDADKIAIPIHAFDIIIADECHRGYTSKDTNVWRNVLNYFDAVKIGLTATPASHTVAYFGIPIYRYTVEQAVLDGYLVDYQAIKIKSDVRINGVFIKEGEKVGLKDPETGAELIDMLEDEREFNSEDIEKKITSPDSNRKILEEIKKYALEHEQRTGRFPKTLIFAVNDIPNISHADQLVRLARKVFGRGDDFVQKITGSPSVDRPLEKIRRFRNRPDPGIVVTVDMLSTGVDIPALEFIVFLRPVKSRILWTQMLGRGTRKCPDINKEYFTIFDCFDGTLIEYFKNSTDFVIEIQETGGETVTIEQIIENVWNNIEREYNTKRLIKRLRRIENTMSAKAREDFSKYIPNGDIAKFADDLTEALKNDFIATMNILRNKDFQNLLVNYDRAKSPFYIAYDTMDSVVSEPVFKYNEKELKPVDYLTAFSEFIQNNKEKIEALSILFSNPRKWNTKALNEIREILKKHSFNEEQLRKAYELSGHKSMVDIISMIKNADDRTNPLLTAEERVDRAIEALKREHTFTAEQLEWLNYIRQHLVVNLAIEKDNFDLVPVLERHGGLAKARKIFGNDLDQIIEEINYKLVA
ncbi:MAG: DEAD/DEAH box helicase family protein [Thermoflavifilum sp.]|uniref:type I restriction endonuclease subunit R n=1 Tax=Thermoflavifilum sp. TaxID=1968839 RepID=UPI0018A3A2AE|nr:type I restriction-modification enzyme R subunit C-terminal domain-containing protein [Thermoflavifilum sp.]QOR76334.1 MAG: DEAD/DEAH box helicase family protein [Thermoflavifilum sp.]